MANKYNIGDVLFDFDQFYLKDSQKPKIRTTYRKKIAGKAVKRVVVDGYADSVGTPIYNMQLSIRRANRVAGYLESLGVDKRLIMTRGFGESKNIVEDNERERPEERKVIISVISK
ncbi:OmpA family protein [Vibrio hepatarius]|nr:OmpA family protein [Vibrio hepatarius]